MPVAVKVKPSPFEVWLETSNEQTGSIMELMSEPLADNVGELIPQLTAIEAWNARANTLLAEANAFLDIAEYEGIMTISRDLIALERAATLAAMVANQRKHRDILQGLVDSIKNRLILGESIIKSARETQRHVQ